MNKSLVISGCLLASLLWTVPGSAREGRCVKGDCQNGQGTWLFPNGTLHVGGWSDGKLDGKVVFLTPDGRQVHREYSLGRLLGRGRTKITT